MWGSSSSSSKQEGALDSFKRWWSNEPEPEPSLQDEITSFLNPNPNSSSAQPKEGSSAMDSVKKWWNNEPEPEPTLTDKATSYLGLKDETKEDKLRGMIGMKKKNPTILDEFPQHCGLNWYQRFVGFLLCAGLGVLVFLLISAMFSVLILKPKKLVLLYSMGNLLLVGSTLFLVGPISQLKVMCKPYRIGATLFYWGSFGLCVLAAWRGKGLLCLLCMVVQVLALFWYGLSFVPYARKLVVKIFKGSAEGIMESA